MTKIYLKLILLVIILCSSTANVLADPNVKKTPTAKKTLAKRKLIFKKGSVFILSSQQYLPLLYTRRYSKRGKNLYTTTYSLYTEQKKNRGIIEVVHNKKNRTVVVSLRDLEVNGSPIINTERTSYTTPDMGRFGFIGKVGAMASGKARTKAPGQLTVKFATKKYDYVKAVHLADAHEDVGKDLQVYVLDENGQ